MSDKKVYYSPREAGAFLGVTRRTLLNWENRGVLKVDLWTKTGFKRYTRESLLDAGEKGGNKSRSRRKICYARVSSVPQRDDLERQIEYFRRRFPGHEVVSDIGSGLNFKRKEFNRILEQGIRGDIEEIVVTHRDRLCRFGFELVERIIQRGGGKIVVLDREKDSPESELVNDLISIITTFAARVHGLRAHSLAKKIKEDVRKENEDSEDEDSSEPE